MINADRSVVYDPVAKTLSSRGLDFEPAEDAAHRSPDSHLVFSLDDVQSFHVAGGKYRVCWKVKLPNGELTIPWDISNRDEIREALKSTGKEKHENVLIAFLLPMALLIVVASLVLRWAAG